MRQEELVSILKREYEIMLQRWEGGTLYYRLKFYMKHYAYKSWIRYEEIKEMICAVLALSRIGLPITVPFVRAVLDGAHDEQEIYHKLMYLASYNILEPVKLLKSNSGRYLRGFKLTPHFIKSVYTPITEQEKRLETEGKVSRHGFWRSARRRTLRSSYWRGNCEDSFG